MKNLTATTPMTCDRCEESAVDGMVTVTSRFKVLVVHETFCEIPGDVRVYWSNALNCYVTIPE